MRPCLPPTLHRTPPSSFTSFSPTGFLLFFKDASFILISAHLHILFFSSRTYTLLSDLWVLCLIIWVSTQMRNPLRRPFPDCPVKRSPTAKSFIQHITLSSIFFIGHINILHYLVSYVFSHLLSFAFLCILLMNLIRKVSALFLQEN